MFRDTPDYKAGDMMEAENSRGGASRSPDVGLKNKCVTLEEGEPARQDRGVVDPGLGSGT